MNPFFCFLYLKNRKTDGTVLEDIIFLFYFSLKLPSDKYIATSVRDAHNKHVSMFMQSDHSSCPMQIKTRMTRKILVNFPILKL